MRPNGQSRKGILGRKLPRNFDITQSCTSIASLSNPLQDSLEHGVTRPFQNPYQKKADQIRETGSSKSIDWQAVDGN